MRLGRTRSRWLVRLSFVGFIQRCRPGWTRGTRRPVGPGGPAGPEGMERRGRPLAPRFAIAPPLWASSLGRQPGGEGVRWRVMYVTTQGPLGCSRCPTTVPQEPTARSVRTRQTEGDPSHRRTAPTSPRKTSQSAQRVGSDVTIPGWTILVDRISQEGYTLHTVRCSSTYPKVRYPPDGT